MNKLWGVKTLSRTKMFLIFVPNEILHRKQKQILQDRITYHLY